MPFKPFIRITFFVLAAVACGLLAAPQASAKDDEKLTLLSFTATPGKGTVTLDWSATTERTEAPIDYFVTWYETDDKDNTYTRPPPFPVNQVTITSVTDGTSYTFEGSVCQRWPEGNGFKSECTDRIDAVATPFAQ